VKTIEERAGAIVAESLTHSLRVRGLILDDKQSTFAAGEIVRHLIGSGIRLKEQKRSNELSTRFHAHCSWIARHGSSHYSQDEIYSMILSEAVQRGVYPASIIVQRVTINSAVHEVEVRVPHSTTRASNRELLAAYEILEAFAAEEGVRLPEHLEYVA
jgi:hypothetical protein